MDDYHLLSIEREPPVHPEVIGRAIKLCIFHYFSA